VQYFSTSGQSKARFPAIGNATQRNASAVMGMALRKQIETSSIFSVRRKDNSQSEQRTAMT